MWYNHPTSVGHEQEGFSQGSDALPATSLRLLQRHLKAFTRAFGGVGADLCAHDAEEKSVSSKAKAALARRELGEGQNFRSKTAEDVASSVEKRYFRAAY